MITLKDLLELMFDVTQMEVLARNHDGRLIHSFYFAEKEFMRLPFGTRKFIREGKKTFIPEKINVFGTRKGNGQPEIGYQVTLKAIPKELLEAEVTHMLDYSLQYGRSLYAEVAMHPLQVEAVKTGLQKRAYVLTAADEESW